MDRRLLWRAAAVELLVVAALFVVLLLLPLPRNFFKDWGAVVGPAAWIGASLITGRILSIALPRLALASAAGGIAAGVSGLAVDHVISLPVAVAVFSACCAARLRRFDRPTPAAASE